MALYEADREDLLAEATGLPRRIVLSIPDLEGEVFVGFRRSGCASVYVNADPVFQFNLKNELRRGFWQGNRLAAEQHQLCELSRTTSGGKVVLIREPVEPGVAMAYFEAWQAIRSRLIETLPSDGVAGKDQAKVIGVVPADQQTEIVAQVLSWLNATKSSPRIAETANADAT